MEKEERNTGEMAWRTYMYYIRAAAGMWALLVVLAGCATASNLVITFWLGEWSSAPSEGHGDEDTLQQFLVGYMLLSLGEVLLLGCQSLVVARTLVVAAKEMHSKLLASVLAAPVSFFDVTPKGRILTRFSRDVGAVDLQVGRSLSNDLFSIMQLLFIVVGIVIATKGVGALVLLPVFWLYYIVSLYLRRSAIEVKRIESNASSPVMSLFAETMSGVRTIRAYGHQPRFVHENARLVDNHTSSFTIARLMSRWLSVRMFLLGAVVSFAVAVIAIAAPGFLDVAWVAVALTFAARLTRQLQRVVESTAETALTMNSVERLAYYHENITPEVTHDPVAVPADWPQAGVLKLDKVCARYRSNPLVLRNISLAVKAGENIGVCGRTGSGKSSLLKTLTRIIELDSGTIQLDGFDIARVPLQTLRSRVAVIPQDPILFVGSLRFNLDPFEKCTDEEVWASLERVQLKTFVQHQKEGLGYLVEEGGENISQGQRQLFCVARALLKKPKLLLLDEATASVDIDTDAALQDTIRECFADITILTIAHRIGTIMDSDKVLVLEAGRRVEFDSPAALCAIDGGHFKGLVDATNNRGRTDVGMQTTDIGAGRVSVEAVEVGVAGM